MSTEGVSGNGPRRSARRSRAQLRNVQESGEEDTPQPKRQRTVSFAPPNPLDQLAAQITRNTPEVHYFYSNFSSSRFNRQIQSYDLFTPPQGSDDDDIRGIKATVKRVSVNLLMSYTPQQIRNTIGEPNCWVRLILYRDRAPNRDEDPQVPDNLLRLTENALAFTNKDFAWRFKILEDKMIQILPGKVMFTQFDDPAGNARDKIPLDLRIEKAATETKWSSGHLIENTAPISGTLQEADAPTQGVLDVSEANLTLSGDVTGSSNMNAITGEWEAIVPAETGTFTTLPAGQSATFENGAFQSQTGSIAAHTITPNAATPFLIGAHDTTSVLQIDNHTISTTATPSAQPTFTTALHEDKGFGGFFQTWTGGQVFQAISAMTDFVWTKDNTTPPGEPVKSKKNAIKIAILPYFPRDPRYPPDQAGSFEAFKMEMRAEIAYTDV